MRLILLKQNAIDFVSCCSSLRTRSICLTAKVACTLIITAMPNFSYSKDIRSCSPLFFDTLSNVKHVDKYEGPYTPFSPKGIGMVFNISSRNDLSKIDIITDISALLNSHNITKLVLFDKKSDLRNFLHQSRYLNQIMRELEENFLFNEEKLRTHCIFYGNLKDENYIFAFLDDSLEKAITCSANYILSRQLGARLAFDSADNLVLLKKFVENNFRTDIPANAEVRRQNITDFFESNASVVCKGQR
jgi:hypothetical protein